MKTRYAITKKELSSSIRAQLYGVGYPITTKQCYDYISDYVDFFKDEDPVSKQYEAINDMGIIELRESVEQFGY